jgi:ppGpp synthetase/RelA/SpoT-type nucleotidyltranferase
MEISMTEEQREFVAKYQKIYNRLEDLDGRMKEIQAEARALVQELETLREEERTKFKTEE